MVRGAEARSHARPQAGATPSERVHWLRMGASGVRPSEATCRGRAAGPAAPADHARRRNDRPGMVPRERSARRRHDLSRAAAGEPAARGHRSPSRLRLRLRSRDEKVGHSRDDRGARERSQRRGDRWLAVSHRDHGLHVMARRPQFPLEQLRLSSGNHSERRPFGRPDLAVQLRRRFGTGAQHYQVKDWQPLPPRQVDHTPI